ncbi:hypothetical protein [Kibdelosporangium phytohabitans]|uniref:Uncharacterized protein n=1 Tax=Kibdelosporangium phytohabitans TaxID=860235 RepID=A0A0N9I2D1_9PSEU|nr:hypothetical protein [Kibdelosporangium phytohabitans]ALG10178.1 hypothetical protein AOZ06_27720 [Kibdelosporangium phytohabitans]MBE1461187.1 broad specificity phosphatase PhoE [Kibdelosporangium phytohabitans]
MPAEPAGRAVRPRFSARVLPGVLRLGPESTAALNDRVREVIAEFADEPDGEPLSYLWPIALRPPTTPDDPSRPG